MEHVRRMAGAGGTILIGVVFALVAQPVGAQVNVCPGDTQGDPGETVDVPILIDNPQGVSVFGLDLLYESSVLEYQATLPSGLTAAWVVFEGNEVSPGVVRVGGVNLEPISISTPDTLGYVSLRVLAAPPLSTYLFTNFEDDLAGAADCQGQFNAINPVAPTTWGRVKALWEVDG